MRRALRSPFVVTLALLGAGCGSGSDEPSASDAGTEIEAEADTGAVTESEADAVADAATDAGSEAEIDAPINPAECPPTDPGFGAKNKPCTAPTAVRCSYVDGCELRPADAGPPYNVYICHDSGSGATWTLVDDYTPDCPATAPSVGDPCPCSPHMLYVACLFGTCEGLDRVFFDCQTADDFQTTWKSTPVSCNPPEPDGGLDGDADATDAD